MNPTDRAAMRSLCEEASNNQRWLTQHIAKSRLRNLGETVVPRLLNALDAAEQQNATLQQVLSDTAMVLRRMLRRAQQGMLTQDNIDLARDFLRRNGLNGNPLRKEPTP